jgi:2-polyprenyl-3-methyl-5-hydroxy-6-metoxy-1,4-benzoquinol methylase
MESSWRDSNDIIHSGNVLVKKDGIDVIECGTCGFKHIVPLTSREVQEEFYSKEFYQKEKNKYINNNQKDADWGSIENNEKFDYFEANLANDSVKRILDIGSGPGFFLKLATERGWDSLGIEPGIPAYEFSSKTLSLNVKNEFFDRDTYNKNGQFSVVHLNNVLEHVIEPLEMLKMAWEILLPGGIICITSPNDFSPLQILAVETLKKDPWWVVPKHHINYFDLNSLKSLMEKSGFRVLYQTSSFPLEIFLLMGEDYIGDSEVGNSIHFKRMLFEKQFRKGEKNTLKRNIYDKMSEIGLGREATIFGIKKNE